MQGNSNARTHRRRATVLRWSASFFVIAGIGMLSWSTWLLADAGFAQWEARHSLETVTLAASVAPPRLTGWASSAPASTPKLHPGSAIGALSIPRVALGAIVLHGSDAQTLRRGPGHMEDTALPGKAGNAVIAGHRDSFFRGLGEVIVGDDIFIDSGEGQLHYRVTSTRVVNAHDLSVVEQTDDATLTLITCYPFWVLGPAPDRFVVRAALVANASFATLSVPPAASYEPVVAHTAFVAAASEGRTTNKPSVHDDTTLVRQAIERFRVIYNARLSSHHDERPGGALTFHSCDVTFADSRAIATCAPGSPAEAGDNADAWTIALERAGHDWAIKTIVSD
jgi:sortase A